MGPELKSGISLTVKQLKPEIKVFGVEAENAPAMLESIEKGERVELRSASTFADGIAVREPGKVTFPIVKDYVDKIVTVSEEEMKSAVKFLAEKTKTVAEAAGATSVAALLSKKLDLKNKDKVVCMICGGNIDREDLRKILNNESRTSPKGRDS